MTSLHSRFLVAAREGCENVIWDVLQYHGCDPNFIKLLQHLYCSVQRRFRLCRVPWHLESHEWFTTGGSAECYNFELCSETIVGSVWNIVGSSFLPLPMISQSLLRFG